MDIEVQAARTAWREALEGVDEIVDQFVAREPLDSAEWVVREEWEHTARRAYYALLRDKYGLPMPQGLDR
jgi:hypothetical protein